MIIQGSVYDYPSSSLTETIDDKKKRLFLNFIFQVNGKMVQFQHSFDIEYTPESGENVKGWGFIDWSAWYAVFELFQAMGYSFGESFTQNSVKQWIERLMRSE